MAYPANLRFDRRIDRIEKKHKKLSRGAYTTVIRDDGLMVLRPRRTYGIRSLTLIICILVAGMCFKALAFVSLGEATFEARVAQLQSGTAMERYASYLVEMDPGTAWIVDQVNVLRNDFGMDAPAALPSTEASA